MFNPAHDRYRNDPYFHQLVDAMLNQIRTLQTTPTEIREAAMYAQYMYEFENPRALFITNEQLNSLGWTLK